VRTLAEREGVDPDADPRPRILATLFAGLVSLASRDWEVGGAHDADAMLAAFDAYAGRLDPALFGHWTYVHGVLPLTAHRREAAEHVCDAGVLPRRDSGVA
jgi:hypothetical protein